MSVDYFDNAGVVRIKEEFPGNENKIECFILSFTL